MPDSIPKQVFLDAVAIVTGAAVGIGIDVGFDKLGNLHPWQRIFLQFLAILVVVTILRVIGQHYTTQWRLTTDVFFISIFLGVQDHLFQEIFHISDKLRGKAASSVKQRKEAGAKAPPPTESKSEEQTQNMSKRDQSKDSAKPPEFSAKSDKEASQDRTRCTTL